MKNRTLSTIVMLLLVAVLLTFSGVLAVAATGAPMTPELAAKREAVRQQQDQRITPEKRKAAIEALKAERLKVHNAKQAVQQASPAPIQTK